MARFHMEAVLGLSTATDVRKKLRELPRTQDEMYERTVERIKSQEKKRANCGMHTIGWILHAACNLHIEQLRHAILI